MDIIGGAAIFPNVTCSLPGLNYSSIPILEEKTKKEKRKGKKRISRIT